MKKKILIISITSIAAISILILCIFLFGNDKESPRNIISMRVASSITNQIQHIDEFRLDKIVIDVKYDDENSQHMVLNKNMIDDFDLVVGYQELKLKDDEQTIPILIYDDKFINNNYIYYFEDTITYGKNIYEIEVPKKEDVYFYGWFSDESCSLIYHDEETRINHIFPGFSMYEAYKVDFYLDGKIIDRQYVLSGARPNPVGIENNELFYSWTPNVTNVFKDMKHEAVMLKDNEHLVEFYDGDELIDFKVVKNGEDVIVDEPIKDGYIFKGWDQELTNITSDLKVYAKFYKEKLTVKFYSAQGELLETDYVNSGESTTFDSKKDWYDYVGFSHSLDNIVVDMDVTVYMTRKVCTYYVDGMVYAVKYYGEHIDVPTIDFHTGHWVEFEEGKFKAEYKKNTQVFIFNFVEDNNTCTLSEKEAMSVNWFIYFYEKYGYIYEFYDLYDGEKINNPHEFIYQVSNVEIKCVKRDFSTFDYDEDVYGSEGFNYDVNSDCYVTCSISYDGITYLKGGYDSKYDRVINKVSDNIFNNYEIVILGKDITEIVYSDRLFSSVEYIIVEEGNPNFYSRNGSLFDKNTGECIFDGGDA